VIAARSLLIAQGLADPRAADLAEMSLMGTEKAEAMTASAEALADHAGAMGERLAKATADETRLATLAARAVAQARTPAEAAQAQMQYAMGWWGRAGAQWLALNDEIARAQADALAPIHKAATANAKRLRKG